MALRRVLVAALMAAAACSSTPSPSDRGMPPPDARVRDLAREAALAPDRDTSRDGPRSDIAVDARVADRSLDARPDKGSKDVAPADLGTPSLYGYVTRAVAPLLDGKGTLVVGLYDPIFPIVPQAYAQLTVDMAAANATVPYAIYNVKPGAYVLSVFLDDNNNLNPVFLGPDPGDLHAASTSVTIGTAPLQKNVVLDQVFGFASGDGGVKDGAAAATGALKGKVRASVLPKLDGKGTLYLSLHSQVPPAGLVAQQAIQNVDLGTPFATESFLFVGAPGKYYLRVFLDDNGNAALFNPQSDAGDLVHAATLPVRLEPKLITPQDVVLDTVQP